MFNAIPQLSGFFTAITFMSLPIVAVTMMPVGAFTLLMAARLLKKMLPPDTDPDPRLGSAARGH